MAVDDLLADPAHPADPADHRRGPLRWGERVQLTDPKGRLHTITLTPDAQFHTHRGHIDHQDLVGCPEGWVQTNTAGIDYLALRPLLADFVLSMPRGAAVVYPKDAAMVVAMADIFPGARVVEAGVGSGALTMSLLRAVGDTGLVHSFERRADFADVARGNIETFFGHAPASWRLTIGDLATELPSAVPAGTADRVVLDMLAPWECLEAAAGALRPGGVLVTYVASTTQLSRVAEAARAAGCWTEPTAFETLLRGWHLEGLAVRPQHRMNGHTGFLLTVRRMAIGIDAPVRRRRPAKGSYPVPTEDAVDASASPVVGTESSGPEWTEEDLGIRPVTGKKARRAGRAARGTLRSERDGLVAD